MTASIKYEEWRSEDMNHIPYYDLYYSFFKKHVTMFKDETLNELYLRII